VSRTIALKQKTPGYRRSTTTFQFVEQDTWTPAALLGLELALGRRYYVVIATGAGLYALLHE
jgi:hypothetical protein